jgi:pSer/pThr/pTyr-binding forkhead associated (FHA) protein
LSRRHFLVRAESQVLFVEDLKSHNGTAINRMQDRIERRLLHDGDFLFAGSQVFVFLDQTRTG